MFERDAASQESVTYGLAQKVSSLQQEFDELAELRNQQSELLGDRAAAVASGYNREVLERLVQDHRRRINSGQTQDIGTPSAITDTPRTSLGSVFHTATPPFQYQWTWSTTQDTPTVSVNADRNTGTESFSLYGNLDQPSAASCAAAVGIYFRPPIANGILKISANPAVNWNGAALSVFNVAHTDGWTGLFVGRYTLAGGADGTPVDQRLKIWDLNSGWLDSLYAKGSTSGYPLSAQIQVDQSHYYIIWAWSGGSIAADGFYTFNGSGAWSTMSVAVPSISWELF
jgi:hypothetical protein